jgi:hypothetical protein
MEQAVATSVYMTDDLMPRPVPSASVARRLDGSRAGAAPRRCGHSTRTSAAEILH